MSSAPSRRRGKGRLSLTTTQKRKRSLSLRSCAGASLAALRAATGAVAAVPARPETLVGYANLTLEQMVREEIRPLLKAWLDENLPPLVERLVKAELERIARG